MKLTAHGENVIQTIRGPEKFSALKQRPRLIAGLFALLIFMSLVIFLVRDRDQSIQVARDIALSQEKTRELETVKRIENVFSLSYDALRTMALLPSTRRVDRYGKNLAGDGGVAIQQIYNSIASHVSVSEIYLVPRDFEPDQVDLKTHRNQTPITTFDHLIVGKNGDLGAASEAADRKSEFEEVEIFEYREMKNQIAQFALAYPLESSFKGIEYPVLLSAKVITCDNSEMTKQKFAANDDYSRHGFVLSVPFYDLRGELKGMVSLVLRLQVLERLLPDKFYSLDFDADHTAQIQISDQFIYQSAIPILSSLLKNKIRLQVKIPQHAFDALPEIQNALERFNRYVLFSVLVSFISGFGLFSVLNSRERAVNMANEMMEVIQRQQVQMIESDRLRSLGEMAGGIAHEINNPLAIISATTARLKRQLADSDRDIEKMKLSVDKISQTVDRMAKIIVGLRNFSRDGSNDPFGVVTANALIAEVLDLCAERLKIHNVSVSISGFDETIIQCRQVQISQVLVNLINNADDAIEARAEKWIRIDASQSHDQYIIRVTDCGEGIPEPIVAKLMDPFFTTKPVGKGTGLGLSISREIIKKHGGTLEYNPASPNTQFVITLPLKQAQSAPLRQAS